MTELHCLRIDVLESIIADLTEEIQEYWSKDPVVAVHDLRCCLDRPERTVRVAADMFQNCATGEGALPILLEMPIRAKLLVKFVEVPSLFAPISRPHPFINLMRRLFCSQAT